LRKKWKELAYSADHPPEDTYSQLFKVWIDKIISCGYCTSVWVAGFFGIWMPKFHVGNILIDWLIITFALHRLATWIHVAYELLKKGRVKTYDLEVLVKIRDEENQNGSTGQSTPEESEET